MASAIDTNSNSNAALTSIQQSTNPSKTEVGQQKLADNFTDFLNMLTVQLQNQDPTEPLKVQEFTNQLVLFSQVEQQLDTNKNLEKMVDFYSRGQIDNAVNYIGKTVDAKGSAGALVGGEAAFVYDLPPGTYSATVTVLNNAGQAVFTGNGSTLTGKNLVTWDGTNSFTGNKERDGIYTIAVNAKDAQGNKLESKTYTSGVVTEAEQDPDTGEMSLIIAGTKVKLSDVKAVRATI